MRWERSKGVLLRFSTRKERAHPGNIFENLPCLALKRVTRQPLHTLTRVNVLPKGITSWCRLSCRLVPDGFNPIDTEPEVRPVPTRAEVKFAMRLAEARDKAIAVSKSYGVRGSSGTLLCR